MLKFKQYIKLHEGGNLVLQTGEEAQKINVLKVERTQIVSIVKTALEDLNSAFKKQFGKPIWKAVDGSMVSGSTRSFFNNKISDAEFAKYKQLVGDLDTMYPLEIKEDLGNFLKASTGKQFGECIFKGIGGNSGTQFNGILELPKQFWEHVRFVQLDFEPVKFENDKPTDFSVLSHYSSWNDIKSGIKGVAVKLLYRAIFSDLEKLDNYVVQTATGKLSKSAKFESVIGKWKFSVDYGVRLGFEPVMDENGNQKVAGGKFVYKETEAGSAGQYIDSLPIIFEMAFNKIPDDDGLHKMKSFVGVLGLLSSMPSSKIESYFERFLHELWSPGAQSLERTDFKKDFDDKNAAVQKFIEMYPKLKKYEPTIQSMLKVYYKGKL